MIARAIDGKAEVCRWTTSSTTSRSIGSRTTAISSARLYWDNAHHPTGGFFDVRGIKIPVAVSAFPDEIYTAPRSWVERAYPSFPLQRLDKAATSRRGSAQGLRAECAPAFRPLREAS